MDNVSELLERIAYKRVPDTILFWRFWHEKPAPSRCHKLSNMKGPAQVAVRGAIDTQPVLFLAKYTDAALQRIRSGVANG